MSDKSALHMTKQPYTCQKKPITQKSNERDLQKRTTKETYKRDPITLEKDRRKRRDVYEKRSVLM